jgi:hypothetical protein
MKVGDKVSMIHGSVKGVITRIVSERDIEIEDEHGFRRIERKSAYVCIQTDSSLAAPTTTQSPLAIKSKQKLVADRGIYFVCSVENKLQLHNNTDLELLVSVYLTQGKEAIHLHAGAISPKDTLTLERKPDNNNGIQIQCIKYAKALKYVPEVLNKHILISELKRSQNLIYNTQLGDKAYTIQLDAETVELSPEELKTALLNPKSAGQPLVYEKVKTEIDLHEESLLGKGHGLSASDIYTIQQQAFHKFIDSALACGHKKVIIIHGAGNGRLREYIHRQLKQNKSVSHFHLAPLAQYGVGATEVHF